MLIQLSELFTCEGKKKEYTVETSLRTLEFGGETYRILEAPPFVLEIESLTRRKFAMRGSAAVTVEGHCARCLEPVSFVCNLCFDREFAIGEGNGQEEDSEEEPYLDGSCLDADRLVCNELLLSLPMRVLCREDCRGICNRCGTNLNFGTCTCDTRSLDPRMSVIQEIFNEFKEV